MAWVRQEMNWKHHATCTRPTMPSDRSNPMHKAELLSPELIVGIALDAIAFSSGALATSIGAKAQAVSARFYAPAWRLPNSPRRRSDAAAIA